MTRGQPLCDLQLLRNTVNQRLRCFPAKARVGNGFAEYAFADLLTAVFQIALNHEALDKLDTIKDSAATTVTTVKELREEIAAVAKEVGKEVKEKVDEVKETVKEAVDSVKDAANDKPTVESTPQE